MDNINLYFIGLWNSFKYYMNCCGDSLYDPEFTHDLNPYYYNGDTTSYNTKDDSDNDIQYDYDSDESNSEILYDSDNDNNINSVDNASIEQENIEMEHINYDNGTDSIEQNQEIPIILETIPEKPNDREIISNTINDVIDQEYDEISSDESFGNN